MPSRISLFDIQVNGFSGVDFQQPGLSVADLRRAVAGLEAHETRRFFLTLITDGIPSRMHRHDNVTQRLLARDELSAFFIPDGIHLPPFVLKNFFRAKPPGKAVFTTDCMAAAGAPAGRYRIARHEVEVGEDRVVRMPGSTHFAGSALEPDRGVANVERVLGLNSDEARALFSTAVATHFGIGLPEIQPCSVPAPCGRGGNPA